MTRYAFTFLLFGTFLCSQATIPESALGAQKPASVPVGTPHATASDQNRHTKTDVAPDTPVITINGFCDNHRPADKSAASSCKTVITRAQFEKVIDAIQPDMPERARREFALDYVDFLVMTKKAEQMGLDKGPSYEEQMRIARIKILSNDLKNAIQQEASRISDKDIEEYYQKNIARFVTAEMDRIYVPKNPQAPVASDATLTDAERQQRSQESERTMKKEADGLYTRAAAGEDFVKLQAEAYQVAGIKSPAPNTSIRIRRISLPPDQVSAMDLNPGQVSPVLNDPNGYVIYKLETKNALPLDQVREEIRATLRSQRMRDALDDIQDSVTSTLDDGYFLPGSTK
jgi:hypothetical protein